MNSLSPFREYQKSELENIFADKPNKEELISYVLASQTFSSLAQAQGFTDADYLMWDTYKKWLPSKHNGQVKKLTYEDLTQCINERYGDNTCTNLFSKIIWGYVSIGKCHANIVTSEKAARTLIALGTFLIFTIPELIFVAGANHCKNDDTNTLICINGGNEFARKTFVALTMAYPAIITGIAIYCLFKHCRTKDKSLDVEKKLDNNNLLPYQSPQSAPFIIDNPD